VAAYFFDSSALVKRYARETGTAWVFSLVRPSADHRLYIARITGVEVVSALSRRERAGLLTSSSVAKALTRFQREFANKYVVIEALQPLLQRR